MVDQLLRRRLVAAEIPHAVEERQIRREPAFRALGRVVSPALLRDLDVVALGDGPGAWWIEDAGALAGDEPPVVAGVVPGIGVGRVPLHELDHVFERSPRLR